MATVWPQSFPDAPGTEQSHTPYRTFREARRMQRAGCPVALRSEGWRPERPSLNHLPDQLSTFPRRHPKILKNPKELRTHRGWEGAETLSELPLHVPQVIHRNIIAPTGESRPGECEAALLRNGRSLRRERPEGFQTSGPPRCDQFRTK